MKDFVKDRFIGSILGLAIGDALGMPFEGRYPAQIRASWKDRNFQPAP
ncbi:MAG TPA: ADP-ribosylglycohydrolase family protein, partial [Candidatus Hypogeohydataceae bacterium YC38]